jgi:hypothetical protein
MFIRLVNVRDSVLRIRDVYPGSRIRLFSIPDPNCLHHGSRILIKEFKYIRYFNTKKTKNWYLSSKKYDPGCSSQIPDPDADFPPIPDPGSGSATLVRVANYLFIQGHDSKILTP